jgi:hypothetical protein
MAVARDGGWGSSGGGDGCPRPRLPWLSWSSHSCGCSLSVVLLLESSSLLLVLVSFGCAAPHFHPACSCSQWRLAFVDLSFHPQSTLQTVASSGSGGHCFSPSFSSCSPFPPYEQLGMPSLCQLIPALRRPVIHPAAGAGSGGVAVRCRLVFHQLGELQCGRGVLTS